MPIFAIDTTIGKRIRFLLLGILSVMFTLSLEISAWGKLVSFHREVVPVLTRAGCNAGACHGSASGRGSLHLSLFGSTADDDHAAITQHFEGRRLNRATPLASLLLRKSLGDLNHGGGDVLRSDSESYRLLQDWIEQGAQLGERPALELLRVETDVVGEFTDQSSVTFQLRALAKYVDQEEIVDVTHLTQFIAADTDAIRLDIELARFVLIRPGRHVIMARYMGRIEPIIVIQPFPHTTLTVQRETENFIDRRINQRLTDLRVDAGPIVTDAEFIRRITLDLTGRLATPDQVRSYINDFTEDKKGRLIDSLLSSSDFVDYWTLIYSRWLHLHSLPNETEGMEAMASWIRRSITDSASWAEMTRQLVTETGDSHTNGPTNFCRMVGDARAHAELVGEVFLGIRLGCANCHDHPLDQWTQDDYHGLAALLARVDRGRHVGQTLRGEVTHPKTLLPARGRLPGDRYLAAQEDWLPKLADWLTEPDRKRVAAPFVNRVWSQMFGRGLVDPVNDHRVTNPATHPELMQELIDRVVAKDYDLRSLLRWIATSDAYARQSHETKDEFYAYQLSRPLESHVLVDAISDVTGVLPKFEGRFSGTRAVQLIDPLEPAPELDVLGRCRRVAGCGQDQGGVGLASSLNLINGDYLNNALHRSDGELARRLDTEQSTKEIVEWFHLYALGDMPNPEEVGHWCQQLDATDAKERRERIEDWLWSVLCSQRFQRNH
jgi:hypothetical protein